MSRNNKLVVLVNASPKTKNNPSVSGFLCNMQEGYMKNSSLEVHRIDVRECLNAGNTLKEFEIMSRADAIIFNFPLYIFCLPGILMRFLQDYVQYIKGASHEGLDRSYIGKDPKSIEKAITLELENTKVITREDMKAENGKYTQRIYCVVNCGFPEANINEEAVGVVSSFSRKIGAMFRFGVMLGGGGMIMGAMEAPFMKVMKAGLEESFQLMADDILMGGHDPIENRAYEASFPRRLYLFAGNRSWFREAKKNGLKKRVLYRRPYISC